LLTACEDVAIKQEVDSMAERYGQVNVQDTMEMLVHAGTLLRVAYAASGDSKAASTILQLFSKHQSFLGDCKITTASFLRGCLNSLSRTFEAMETLMEKGDKATERALKQLEGCAQFASKMAEQAGKVVDKAKDMEESSEKALTEAKESQGATVQEQKQIQRMIDEANSKRKRHLAEMEELNERIKDLTQNEEKYEKKADKEQARAERMMIVQTVVGLGMKALSPLSMLDVGDFPSHDSTENKSNETAPDNSAQANELKKQREKNIKSKTEKEMEIKKLDREIQELKDGDSTTDTEEKVTRAKEERERVKEELNQIDDTIDEIKQSLNQLARNHMAIAESYEAKASIAAAQKAQKLDERREAAGDLAAAAEDLANLSVERSELIKAVKALGVCVKLMGNIKTIFMQVRIFWEAIASICNDLSVYDEEYLLSKSPKRLKFYIKEQMIQWITLGRMNYQANVSVGNALTLVNEGMMKLPTREEAQKLMEEEADKIAELLKSKYEKVLVLESTSDLEMIEN